MKTIPFPAALLAASLASSPASALTLEQAYAAKGRKVAAELNLMARGGGGDIVVSALAQRGQGGRLLGELEALGLKHGAASGRLVTGRLPLAAVPRLEQLASLHSARPSRALFHAAGFGPQGAVVSQGDREMYADQARQRFGVDGSGVKVGVLSNSFDCSARYDHNDYEEPSILGSGDLPEVGVLKERDRQICNSGGDEGAAMLQIVHDLAPGASLAFHSSTNGLADFAAGIRALADAGAAVIVDDTTYLEEPVFQDGGPVADAVKEVVGRGVAYVSAAGNSGRQAYESPFRPSGAFATPQKKTENCAIRYPDSVINALGVYSGPDIAKDDPEWSYRGCRWEYEGKPVELHDFDPGPGVDTCQQLTLQYDDLAMALHWDQPYASIGNGPGADSDVDFFLMDKECRQIVMQIQPWLPGHPYAQAIGAANNIGGDPVETIELQVRDGVVVTGDFGLAIGHAAGPAPAKMRVTYFGHNTKNFGAPRYSVQLAESNKYSEDNGSWPAETVEYAASGPTLYGHPNLPEVITVGAVGAQKRMIYPVIGQLTDGGNHPSESFSALGGTDILFDASGASLAKPEARGKPDIAGVDGVVNVGYGQELQRNREQGMLIGRYIFYGTSAAAAHVGGLVALAKQAKPGAAPAEIAEALRKSAQPLDDSLAPAGKPGFNHATGHGLADGENLIARLLGQKETPRKSGGPPGGGGAQPGACDAWMALDAKALSAKLPFPTRKLVSRAAKAEKAAAQAEAAAAKAQAKAGAKASKLRAQADLLKNLCNHALQGIPGP